MKLVYTILLVLAMSNSSKGQSLNDYKYVIVPEKFDFLKESDKYQLNSLTKFLFEKYGFEAYLERSKGIPLDYTRNSCNVLYAEVLDDSGMINTKLRVELLDCRNNIVFTTEEGISKAKDYKEAYHAALREAFISLKEVNYTYNGGVSKEVQPRITVVKGVKKEVQEEEVAVTKTITPDVKKASGAVALDEVSVLSVQSYVSTDGAYEATTGGTSVHFFEDSKEIGTVDSASVQSRFVVKTTQFSGSGYFSNGQLVVERIIKGISEPIKMIFVKK